ncbi:MAG: CHAT domain-containing protein [Coleofasciculus sp. S288]|nr:CHAT domain-containing protein [Coleofasciculus sp. S288]
MIDRLTERYLNVREGETHDLNQCLTLDAILSLNLEQCRLVTLSACETGLINYVNGISSNPVDKQG